MLNEVICPYCNDIAELVDSITVYNRSYGMIWLCRPCNAYVGVDKSSPDQRPLGALADTELRRLRRDCHKILDIFWQECYMSRTEAYSWMAIALRIPRDEAHISRISREQCRELIEKANIHYGQMKRNKAARRNR